MFFKEDYSFDDMLIAFSALSVLMAFMGAMGYDFYLASTQWMLVAAVLALWGIYYRLRMKK